MKITRKFTKQGQDALASVEYEKRTSRITNPDGSVVFEMHDAEIPKQWSQLATDIMVSKYFRKAGVPQVDEKGNVLRDAQGNVVTGPEKSARQVVHRLAGCWRYWGEKHGYFDSEEDAQAFYDELAHMLLHQMCAPNSPQWFNTGLQWAYGISGPAQGHYYCDPRSGELMKSKDAYTHPQPHACFIQSVSDDLVNEGGIMDLWTREARLFKYGSGTGSNFSRLRGENEPLSGGGKSSGLMSFLKIGDRAAGAIKSGGTTRRAAKMVCLDLDHPDIELFVNWKVREELKVAALAEGIKVLPKDHQELAKKLGLKLDYDFNGEAYYTVSGQNSNNSVRMPNRFFKAVEEDGNWNLTYRTNGKVAKSLRARELWDQIAFAAWRCADPGVQFDDTINQWHTCPRSGRINASNPCVTGDTRVLTPGGIWRRIDQMIHLPTRILTNLSEQKVHVTEGAFPTGVKDVCELRTRGGYCIRLTPDHRVYTRDRGWVEARRLRSGDAVKLVSRPACVQSIGEPIDAQFFQLLGLYISAANGDANALHLDRTVDDMEHADELLEYAVDRYGPGNSDEQYLSELMGESDGGAGEPSTMTQTLSSRRLLSRLSAFLRLDGGQRRLGDDAFTSGLPAQKHLLRALFSADGFFTDGTLGLRGSSAGLLEDLQLLLLGFGVKSSVVRDDHGSAVEEAGVADTQSGALSDRRTSGSALGDSPRATGEPTASNDAASRRHGLRIDRDSLRGFARHIGLLPGSRREELGRMLDMLPIRPPLDQWDTVSTLTPIGKMPVYDLTEPVTSSFIANGITVHNCSEYMFLDDTACNLASLNVLQFFDAESRRFDIDAYAHAIRLWTVVLEISVLMASFPSESIAKLSYRYRTLGLGYANLGAMLMQAGIAYDSEKGRAICAALTAVLTGECYATSAELAREHGPFAGFNDNRADMLRVIRNHRRAAYDVTHNPRARQGLGEYEGLEIKPVGIDETQFSDTDTLASRALLSAARECWDRALSVGERSGYRNAQVSVIAPTGTIGLLMDCDTTGVEPDFALVKFKKLAGGGYFKIANQSIEPALRALGYEPMQISTILKYVMGSLSLEDSPYVNRNSLRGKGFTAEEIDRIEAGLPGAFELAFAFSPYSLGEATMARLGVQKDEWQQPNFNLLLRLGFTKAQIAEANDVVIGRGTIEGAPYLKEEHLAVFDCANKCGKIGQRFISVEGHIRMMAASQPFISGAISKTINLPNEASVEEIKSSYFLSWRLGLKANALYRDGSKLSQPLNVKSDTELDKSEEDDEENVASAKEEVATEVAKAAAGASEGPLTKTGDNIAPAPLPVEKIIERIVERPLRRRLPDTRKAITHKFDVAGHEGYITVGLYDDGSPGEVFITMAKEGSTIGGLMDTIATLVSVALQYGVPVESLVRKFEHVRFEPSGMTRNTEIPFAKSLVDYIFRWLAMEFMPGYRAANAPQRKGKANAAPVAPAAPATPAASPKTGEARGDGSASAAPVLREIKPLESDLPRTDEPAIRRPSNGNGNGHKHTPAEEPAGAALELHPKLAAPGLPSSLRLLVAADPLSQQGSQMQQDAPACEVCGSITVRSGTCYKCLNCGNSMGCS